jgi:hypothetical protein
MFREPFAAAVVACLIAASLLAAHAGTSGASGRDTVAVRADEAGGEVRAGQGYFEEQFKVYGGR